MKDNKLLKNSIVDEKKAGLVYSLAMLSLFVFSIIFSIIVLSVSKGEEVTNKTWYLFLSFLITSVGLGVPTVILMKYCKISLRQITEFKINFKFVIITVLAFLGMFFGLSKINDLVVQIFTKFGYQETVTVLPPYSLQNYLLCTLIICVFPAVIEEIIFRGIMLKGLYKFGLVGSVLISALAFSLYHMSPSKTVYQFIIGVIFAIITIKSSSIIPTIILHFLNNFIVVTLYYFCPNFSIPNPLNIVLTALGILSVALSVVLSFLWGKKQLNFEKQPNNEHIGDFLIYSFAGFLCSIVVWVSAFFG